LKDAQDELLQVYEDEIALLQRKLQEQEDYKNYLKEQIRVTESQAYKLSESMRDLNGSPTDTGASQAALTASVVLQHIQKNGTGLEKIQERALPRLLENFAASLNSRSQLGRSVGGSSMYSPQPYPYFPPPYPYNNHDHPYPGYPYPHSLPHQGPNPTISGYPLSPLTQPNRSYPIPMPSRVPNPDDSTPSKLVPIPQPPTYPHMVIPTSVSRLDGLVPGTKPMYPHMAPSHSN